MKELKEAYAQWERAKEDYVVGREDDCQRAEELNQAEMALIEIALENLGDLIAAVEALEEARDRERNPFEDYQTERYERWSAILKRLGVE